MQHLNEFQSWESNSLVKGTYYKHAWGTCCARVGVFSCRSEVVEVTRISDEIKGELRAGLGRLTSARVEGLLESVGETLP